MSNTILIVSDQHNRNVLGCYGNPIVKTPNIDYLSKIGTRFSHAYTNSPICMPARAALATGLYPHETGNWDNAFPYDGSVTSWQHILRDNKYRVDAIGKLHFRSQEDDNGFNQEINTMHAVNGVGDVAGCLRNDITLFDKRIGAVNAGYGNSSYLRYDLENERNAREWLKRHRSDQKPWLLYLGFVLPHPPTIAPKGLYDLYSSEDLPLPPQCDAKNWPHHIAINYERKYFNFCKPLNEREIHNFLSAYYGMCTYLDQRIGRVLETLRDLNLMKNTRVIYTADHGEAMGARGIFGKFNMYDESTAIPFIMAGPDIPRGLVVETPISLVDLYPTILESFQIRPSESQYPRSGRSLWQIIKNPEQDRIIFSEYHAVGSLNAIFMIRNKRYKYIYYVDMPDQLFDLEEDPQEINDLSNSPRYRKELDYFRQQIFKILDPIEIDKKAKRDQMLKVEAFGGEKEIKRKGTFQNSPLPNQNTKFIKR